MFEIITEAIVLDKTDQGEFDSRVYLYTKDLGKISAKITSARKITSKLAAHSEPQNLITARIVDKNGPQLVDALIVEKSGKSGELVKIFSLVKELAAEGQKDLTLWNFLEKLLRNGFKDGSAAEALGILGFEPTYAKCGHCHKGKPYAFSAEDLVFYCNKCAPSNTYAV